MTKVSMKIKQRDKELEIKRLMKVYNCSRAEAESMYDYDNNYCDSDESAQDYLLNEVPCTELSEKEINEAFYRSPSQASLKKVNASTKKSTKATKDHQKSLLNILIGDLTKKYNVLFPEVVSQDETGATFSDGKSTFSIKLGKHKVQKVVTKEVKRKGIKVDADKKPLPTPATEVELRSMAIENVMRAHITDFIVVSVAGTQFGYITGSETFPFGSVKLTHHKK